MPYVERNPDQTIKGIYATRQPGIAEEFVSDAAAVFTPDLSQLDQDTLNAVLVQDGSVVRALALVMFAEVNKLRVKDGDPAYTLTQFKNALKAQMRTP